jgi:hypothetical protein
MKWTDQGEMDRPSGGEVRTRRRHASLPHRGSQLAETWVTLAGLGIERPGGAETLDEPAVHEVRGRT